MSSRFQPLEIPPGVVAKATKKQRSSNWSEVNLCRWTEGQLAPIGGQAQYTYSFASPCRAVHGWYGLDQTYHIAYLCEAHLYVDTGGTLTDITPTGGMIAPTPPSQGGYSDGVYNDITYSTPRTIGADVAIDRPTDCFCSLNNFGAILLAMTSPDGRLLAWDPKSAPGTKAAVVTPKAGSTVPHGRCFVVTPERFVIIFGSTQDGTTGDGGSFRRMAWCDQEDYTAWDYASQTSQAGFIDIEPASPIVTALATRSGVLFWTGKKAYLSRYLGLPYVYNYVELADNCTPWSPQSAVTTSSLALWMSQQGLFAFDGTSIGGVACPVRPWVDDDVDLLNVREYSHAVHVANFSEFWWFFPQQFANSQSNYPTRAIIYNYRDGWFGQARMSRTAGVTASYTSHTIMADKLVAFEHEQNFIYNHAELPWAETFDLNINSGATLTTVKQLLPDVEGAIDNVLYSLFYRNSRSVGAPEAQTDPQIVRPNGYVDFRVTGRDIRLRIDLAAPAGFIIDPVNNVQSDGSVRPVTVGQHLIDAVPRGDR